MQPHVKLYIAFKGHALYPRGRKFTKYEAFLDLLIFCQPSGKGDWNSISNAWHWPDDERESFRKNLIDGGFITVDTENPGEVRINKADLWYNEPESQKEGKKAEFCKAVIDLYNKTFDRKIHYTPERTRMIWSRYKLGTKKNPITIESFKAVFEHMKKQWSDDPQMSKHLELETLVRPSNFMKYLDNARDTWRKGQKQENKIFNPTEIK